MSHRRPKAGPFPAFVPNFSTVTDRNNVPEGCSTKTFIQQMPAIEEIVFKRDEKFNDWWVSDPTCIPYLKNSPLLIRITDLPDDDFADDQFPGDFSDAVLTFLRMTNHDRLSATSLVYKYYKELEPCSRILPRMLLGKSQVWHYSEPRYITVFRLVEDGKIYLTVSFECEWEVEHGMSFVFQNGDRLIRVGPDDFYQYSSVDSTHKNTEQDGEGNEDHQVSIKHWTP